MTPPNYNHSVVLFRRAVAAQRKAAELVRAAAADAEARFREVDECIVTIVLTHAAVETAWHWEHLIADVPARGWPARFADGLADIAATRARPAPEPLSEQLLEEWLDLAAWRNFLQHGDATSRARLASRTGHSEPHEVLGAALAETAIATGDKAFAYIAAATGGQLVGPSQYYWVNPAEIYEA